MENPRRGRVEERHFLNLPGYHAGAYVLAYIQDTSNLEVTLPTEKKPQGEVPEPHMRLEISDCSDRVELWFEIADPDDRMNAFHKINTLIAALETFRDGLRAESELRRTRVAELERARTAAQQSASQAATWRPQQAAATGTIQGAGEPTAGGSR